MRTKPGFSTSVFHETLSAIISILYIVHSLSKRLDQVEEHIEGQLRSRHEDLVNWFKMVEFPRIAGFFIPLLKKWSMEYAGRFVS